MKITAIKRQKTRKECVKIYFESEPGLILAAEVVLRAGLRKGDVLNETELRKLQDDDAAWRAREAALRLLSYRARAEGELRRRLLARGFAAPVVEACITNLQAAGLIDDSAFARAYLHDRIRSRPSGPARLIADLRGHGLSADDAERAVMNFFDENEESEGDLVARALRKFRIRQGEEPDRTRRRAYAFLSRRGFSSDEIGRALELLIDT